MDLFPGYRQIPSLGAPPLELLVPAEQAAQIAALANDELATLVAREPARFPAFIGGLPLADPQASLREVERLSKMDGVVGVQVYTSVDGHPLDDERVRDVLDRIVELGLGIWLHPVRSASVADYPAETKSKFDLWWAVGWPHETSVAMGRLVFDGFFERHPGALVVTHHAGGTVPMIEGRLGPGLATPGRTDEDMVSVDVLCQFRKFFADTATFGSHAAIACAREFFGLDHLLFATDFPFGGENGATLLKLTRAAVDALGLTAAQKKGLLSGNARHLLKLEGR